MGHYLATPNKEKVSEEGEHKTMKYAASSMQGWRVNMEDAHIARFNIAPEISLFGVFDGHGGAEVAKYVVKHFEEELLKNPAFKAENYPKALTDTFLRMDELLRTPEGKKELQELNDGESYAGCTACVALLVKNKLYVANAGDSRCVIASRGECIALTTDHKPDDKPEKDRILKAGGEVYDGRINGRLNLSRALGDFDYKGNEQFGVSEQLVIAVPDITSHEITSDDDLILLGCDGIWECLPGKQICEFLVTKLKNKKSMKSSLEELLDYIIAPNTQTGLGLDNMTVVGVTLK